MIGAILPLPAPPPSSGDSPPPPQADPETAPEPAVAATVATHTLAIGMIHPPPDIRIIIEKTATFVAKNGPQFERRIVADNASNPKFNFLSPSDPFHAYYQHRISEIAAQPQQPTSDSALPPTDDKSEPAEEGSADPTKPDHSAPFRINPKKLLVKPDAEVYTVRLPEGITGEELDIIKLTAQFVARNGKSFLESLLMREANNPQFHFLRPTHSMFTFFTGLADAYSKVLKPSSDNAAASGGVPQLIKELRDGAGDMTTVLERCLDRLEWDRSQEQARQKAEDELEEERMLMAMIDWHDFVVVETIEFADDEDEELPMPVTLEEVIRRSKMASLGEEEYAETAEPGKVVEMEMDEEEVQLVKDAMNAVTIDENGGDVKKGEARMAVDENEPPMRIVKNYKRPEERLPPERDPTKFVVSPITNELIPINEMAEHIRISLIDPKYREQKERMLAKIKETTLAPDDEISRNIMGLARTRPDIFGTTEEEVSNAVKAEIEKKKDEQPKQVIWDGHSGSINRTATQALSQGMGGEEQNDNANMGILPGPTLQQRPGVLLPRPPTLPLLNVPRVGPNLMQYPGQMQPYPGAQQMMPNMRQLQPPMPGQQPYMMGRPPMPQMVSMNQAGMAQPPPPPGHQYQMVQRPFGSMPMQSQPNMPHPMGVPPPPPMNIPPPPPPEEAPPPLPDEPEPKKQRMDDTALIPEDQFLAQHPGPTRISLSVPNVDEGNLRGQVLEIAVGSLSETVASLKEKIAGEVQLPANKQKLSGRAGFLKDNLTLAYYNIGPGDLLTLALRERGGRKK